ncbi:MAG: succinate--CoA ligase subunit alpha [Polyangia bacterium]|jgi:succinyl-CoA synthetase alpha subunit|nr:succinate--CoA ligase subunit alpha [Polyangia bacterium]
MSIWVNSETRVLVQNITGRTGRFHTQRMLGDGTKIVAGSAPGKAGEKVEGVPVWNTVAEAVRETGANASVVFVPAPGAADAMLEAAAAGVKVVVVITEGIPTLDMVRALPVARSLGARIIGPNCPGIISPGQCKIGIMPYYIHKPGRVGVISRSGTLTYEAVDQLTRLGLGQSTCIGIGGDPVIGSTFVDVLGAFEEDSDTDAVLMIGEIGGSAEEEAAAFVRSKMSKPVAAFIAGQTAPPGKRMGHAGAIIAGGKGTAREKIAALREAGIEVADSPARMGVALRAALGRHRA